MEQNTNKLEKKYEVERTGLKIILPEGSSIPECIVTLQRHLTYEEETVNIVEQVPGAFWDGAYAFSKALERRYGFVHAAGYGGATMISVPVSVTERVNVPWGKFKVPNVEGFLATSYTMNSKNLFVFQIAASVKRRDEKEIKALAEVTREIARVESIYRGKAIRMRFKDDDGDRQAMLEPQYMDVSGATVESLILSKKIMAKVETSIFTPIMFTDAVRATGVPLKRGVLLGGIFGTGKTKTAYTAAMLCMKHGWTFVYCERADELEDAVRFAQTYSPAVVFCEDIDRVTAGERDLSMDALLDIIDGIESKDNDIMVVLTTNNAAAIHKAAIRPGRLDDVIKFEAPDAESVERLIRFYAGHTLVKDADLTDVGALLQGQIPATIRECVERSKLSQIKLQKGDVSKGVFITAEALLDAGMSMADHIELMNTTEPSFNRFEALGRLIGEVSRGRGDGRVKIDGFIPEAKEPKEELPTF